jgi:hypothetical protein
LRHTLKEVKGSDKVTRNDEKSLPSSKWEELFDVRDLFDEKIYSIGKNGNNVAKKS